MILYCTRKMHCYTIAGTLRVYEKIESVNVRDRSMKWLY